MDKNRLQSFLTGMFQLLQPTGLALVMIGVTTLGGAWLYEDWSMFDPFTWKEMVQNLALFLIVIVNGLWYIVWVTR